MNRTHFATARALLLGSTRARFTDAQRGQLAFTPFCLAADGAPLLRATAGAPVSIALAGDRGTLALVLRGRAASSPPDDAACERFRHHHEAECVPPVRLVEPRALLATGGERHALDYASLVADALFDAVTEMRVVKHMNDDHVDALRAYCAHAGVTCRRRPPRMAGIDRHGFFVLADAGAARFAFPTPCATVLDVRKALVALARVARGSEPGDA